MKKQDIDFKIPGGIARGKAMPTRARVAGDGKLTGLPGVL
jgi:hypothetical protein